MEQKLHTTIYVFASIIVVQVFFIFLLFLETRQIERNNLLTMSVIECISENTHPNNFGLCVIDKRFGDD
jgi:hypothetical protein